MNESDILVLARVGSVFFFIGAGALMFFGWTVKFENPFTKGTNIKKFISNFIRIIIGNFIAILPYLSLGFGGFLAIFSLTYMILEKKYQ